MRKSKDCGSNIHFEGVKYANNIAHFVRRGKYIYSLNEEGTLSKFNPKNRKFRFQQELKEETDMRIFTSLLVVKECIVVSAIHSTTEETSTCDIELYSKERRLMHHISVEAKAFRLFKPSNGTFYDPNPIHSMAMILNRHVNLILATHYGMSIQLILLNGRRLHFIVCRCLTNSFNCVISGVKSIDNIAFVFGWKMLLKRIII